MPLYDYRCEDCGDFRSWQRMSESADDVACPSCAGVAARLVTAPSLALMANNNRVAHARNEKSADQPAVVNEVVGEWSIRRAEAMAINAAVMVNRTWRARPKSRSPLDDRPLKRR